MSKKKIDSIGNNNDSNVSIVYALNKKTKVELVFFESTNKKDISEIKIVYDIDNVIIMKQGEFLLLFLNADFSNKELALKTFFDLFPKDISQILQQFNTIDELLDFQFRLRNCVNFVFEYKTYTEDYEDQFRDYISNAQGNMSISKQKENIKIYFDTKIIEINDNYEKVNKTLLKDFGYTKDIFFSNSIPQLLYIMLKDFTLSETLPIRKCKNCGRFFMAKKRKDELYCDNLFKNTGKTCKQIGAMNTYKQKLANDELTAIYKNMIKRKYMRVKRNPDKKELGKAFEEWKKNAKIKYEKYINNEITDNEFEKWLKENDS